MAKHFQQTNQMNTDTKHHSWDNYTQ